VVDFICVFAWRKRFTVFEQCPEIQGLRGGRKTIRKMLRYTRIAEVAAGLFLSVWPGILHRKDHFHLIRDECELTGMSWATMSNIFPGSDGAAFQRL